MDRRVKGTCQLVRVGADGGSQVGAADIADEQCIAGEYRIRARTGLFAYQYADRLPGVPGSLQDLEFDLTEGDLIAVAEGADLVFGFWALPR